MDNVFETGRVPDLTELADRLAIHEVLGIHSRGVDRADTDILKSAYWPDAEVACGGFNGSAHAFCEMLPGAIKRYQATQHTVTNVLVERRDADALVESYVTAYHLASVDSPETEMTYLGRYVDHMQCREGVWKILFRCVVMDWNQHQGVSATFDGPTFSGLARGDRAPDDPLFSMRERVFGG